jgi:hypothetical protein
MLIFLKNKILISQIFGFMAGLQWKKLPQNKKRNSFPDVKIQGLNTPIANRGQTGPLLDVYGGDLLDDGHLLGGQQHPPP